MASCSAFLALFIDIHSVDYHEAPAGAWIAFALIVIFGCTLSLANIGTSVAVERDWVTAISSEQPEATLTRLNTYMRRIDLLCKLLAPLFVSLLSTAASYTFAVAFQMGFAAITLLFELWWIRVVFNHFPILAVHSNATSETLEIAASERPDGMSPAGIQDTASNKPTKPRDRLLTIIADWKEFSCMPVFASSIAISLLYLTVLS